jgi:hypothetical protein
MRFAEKPATRVGSSANFELPDVESIATPVSESTESIPETRKLQGLAVRHKHQQHESPY